jgi:hypothetical protein
MDAPLCVLVYCVGMVCQPVAPYFSITHAECLRAQAGRADYRCYSQWHDQIVPGDGYGRPAEPTRDWPLSPN